MILRRVRYAALTHRFQTLGTWIKYDILRRMR